MSVVERVLVTGAAGFIGGHLCEQLASQGRHVVGVDNFDNFYSRDQKEGNVRRLRAAGAMFEEADIRNFDQFSPCVDTVRPDAVVHLAGIGGVRNSLEFPRRYIETNFMGTQNVLDVCRNAGVEQLVIASTSSVYGHTAPVPFVETDSCAVPPHPYAASKRSAELVAGTYSSLYDMQITVFRLFTVYGPFGRPDMMPRLLLDSVSHGREIPLFEGDLARDWTYIDDVVAGLTLGVDTPLGFEIINLGRGSPQPVREFINQLEQVSGRSANLVSTPCPESELRCTYASTDKLQRLLAFQPSTSIADGVDALWDWWNMVESERVA
ncbi:MAG: SDR family NAD(P)-dependent oxidoreductase [Actinomycetia bacterium]|nr:SDR family NAD(P)-dependent oxidoreductase [Actinomycetes bacterium]MCP5031062.1 SDR family NAD(P)-dependent oxidoreductase [Actinomycetes bacterium]